LAFKNLSNLAAFGSFNHLIQIDEAPAQLSCQCAANRTLTHRHEPDERDVFRQCLDRGFVTYRGIRLEPHRVTKSLPQRSDGAAQPHNPAFSMTTVASRPAAIRYAVSRGPG
jgi:hypothetical protein